MRDEQVRRYARHILLPDVGGLGQTALMVAAARVELRESEPEAELTCATYLAAGGVGTLVVRGATDAQVAELAAHGGDTTITTTSTTTATTNPPAITTTTTADGAGREVALSPRPAWWPTTARDDDAIALAFWRGSLAAVRWMADVVNR